jgi:chaperonin GroES
MKFRPLHDRVVVRRTDSEETKTAGGIIIPDTASREAPAGRDHRGRPGRPRREPASSFPSTSRRAIKVLFGKWSGTEVKIDGKELLIMKESDIMGVLDR